MYSQRALQEYTATSVQTGTPVQLVVMLYEGAMRFLHEAEVAIDRRDMPLKAEKINRAMRIVQELSNALDESASADLVQRLRALYEYAEYEMLQASTFNDARHLRHASSVLARLHGSWKALAEQTSGSDATAPTPVEVPAAPPSAPTPWSTPSDEAHERVPSLSISA